MVRTPSHVRGPRVGLGKPPSIQDGTRTSTDPGTRIVNRIVFRMGPSARVILTSKDRQQDSCINLTVKSINDGRESRRSGTVFQSGSPELRVKIRVTISQTSHPPRFAVGTRRITLRKHCRHQETSKWQ